MSVVNPFKKVSFKPRDIRASFVVFLVSVPLCLGIALASGAPPSSGLIAGIVGGLILGLLSPSEISVAGPAAGLTLIVLEGIKEAGSFEMLCLLTVLAGLMQIALGLLRFGIIGNLIPSSVIKGMLAAIGIIIILKQIPHALGLDADFFGDESFRQNDGDNTFTAITHSLSTYTPGAMIISALSIVILIGWNLVARTVKAAQMAPPALLAVVCGVIANEYILSAMGLGLEPAHLVQLPEAASILTPINPLSLITSLDIHHIILAVTIALVGSLEAILALDASEKLDPLKRNVDGSKELTAQGIGNFVSGLLGGLPLTAVIVRTSVNVSAGALNRSSAILNAVWLAVFVSFFPQWLNKIPLAALAVVLIFVGFKLTSPKLYKTFLLKGKAQMIPFLVTILAILFTDLLIGVGIGFLVGIFFVIKTSVKSAVTLVNEENNYLLRFHKDASFLHKPSVKRLLATIPDGSHLIIDGSRSVHVDIDVIGMIDDYVETAPQRNITVTISKSTLAVSPYFQAI